MPSTSPREIQVKLLLSGGHEQVIYLREDSSTLQQLFAALVKQSRSTSSSPIDGLFQLPIEGSRRTLVFPSQHLIGIVTEPAITIEFPAEFPTSAVKQSPYIQIENFLDQPTYEAILNYALTSAADFVPTGPVTNTELYKDYRRSSVIFYPQNIEQIMAKITDLLPRILPTLGLETFPVTKIETQLTAHNDNNYYKIHNDNGSPETADRQLTYVYYFYQSPQPFTGGELTLYDSTDAFTIDQNTSRKVIQPLNNSIVIFPSQFMHEVLPVRCPSQKFSDSRFTINGWIRG
jgi:SM-20-related protein